MSKITELLQRSFKQAASKLAGASVATAMLINAADANKAEAAHITTDAIKVTWNGTIEGVVGSMPSAGVDVGDPWEVMVVVDLMAPDIYTDGDEGDFPDAIIGGTVDIDNGTVLYNIDSGELTTNLTGSFNIRLFEGDVTPVSGLGAGLTFTGMEIGASSPGVPTDSLHDAFEYVVDINGFILNADDGVGQVDGAYQFSPTGGPPIIEPIPEPGTLMLVGTGLGLMAASRRRRPDGPSLEI